MMTNTWTAGSQQGSKRFDSFQGDFSMTFSDGYVSHYNSRRGVTMIEMLVVIGIVSLIIALLLPAVQSARENARRAECVCHLKGMALGIFNYQSSFGSLPTAGTIKTGKPLDSFSAYAPLMPFLEHQHIANAINFEISPKIQTTITHAIINHFSICHSDPQSGILLDRPDIFGEIANTAHPVPINYGLNLGSWKLYDPTDGSGGNGAFVIGGWTRMADFTDGTATTIAMIEGISYQPTLSGNARMFSADMQPPTDPGKIDTFRNQFEARGGHASWASADPLHTGMTIWFPPNSKIPFDVDENEYSIDYINVRPGESTTIPTYAVITPRSYHKKVVNAAMMDGSVRMIRNSIDLRTFRALGTRAGAESVEEFSKF
jgi:prepilin-type N-terminal cleavage/methylation domain-containing protein